MVLYLAIGQLGPVERLERVGGLRYVLFRDQNFGRRRRCR